MDPFNQGSNHVTDVVGLRRTYVPSGGSTSPLSRPGQRYALIQALPCPP